MPLIKKRNVLFSLVGKTTLSCAATVSNQKEWLIYEIDSRNGLDTNQIILSNNPTVDYAELVVQPQSLSYGLYRFVFKVTMVMTSSMNSNVFSSQISTYVKIEPSGIILSSISLSKGIYGGTVEITRGQHQEITFNPFLNSYDIDGLLVITSLIFKYSCQVIDSNIASGYPLMPGTNNSIYLDEIKLNASLQSYDTCFNKTGEKKNL